MTRLKTSLLTIAVLLCSLAASAHDFEVDGIYYNITSDSDLTVCVTFQGDSYNSYSKEYSGDVVIPEKVTYGGKEYSVTSIGYRAFDGCTSLTNVSIPNSVTSIENYAFDGCSSLTSIDIPKSVKYIGVGVFSVCNNLTSIKVDSGNTKYDSRDNCNAIIETNTNKLIAGCKNTVIPNSVTSIGSSAFYKCSGLTSIDIPNSVTSIGNYAFSHCSGLTSVTIGNSVTSIGYNSFYYCLSLTNVTIGSSVISIGSHAFDACKNLTSVTIPNSVTSIGQDAFRNCSGLTSVTIGNSVTSIGNYAFLGCNSLTSVEIPNSVTNIGREAFYGCSGLTSVTIGRSVTNIGFWAFYNCSGLTTINIDSDNTIYDSRDNCNAIIETKTNTLIAGCKNTVIPNYVTTIGDYAFFNCSGLTDVIIPNSVTSIGIQAFYGCSGLTSLKVDSGNVKYDSRDNCNAIIETSTNTLYIGCKNTVIPNTVTSIGPEAFSGCSGLTSVTIPNSVTSIGIYAFSGCSGLTSVSIPNSVTNIEYCAFLGCSGLTSIDIPNSVTSIGSCAFLGCSGLTSIDIPNSVTSIGEYAFKGTGWYNDHSDGILYLDSWLIGYKGDKPTGTLEIKEGTRGIANSAFYNCSGLTGIDIPKSVKYIGVGVFSVCNNLTSIKVESGNTNYDSRDNCNAIIETNTNILIAGCKNTIIPNSVTSIGVYAFSGCSGLTSVTIPNSVTSIGDGAFYNCSGLTSMTIPNSVTSIGYRAFDGCSGLTSVTIPNSVASIGSCAFCDCSGLTSVTIPNSVTSIGSWAFCDCSSLTSVTVEHSTPLPVDYNTFALYQNGEPTTNNATLYVPYGSAAAYQSSEGWRTFTRIEEMPGAQFIIPETAAYPDEQFSLPVEMTNTAELTAFQCDVYIPEGLTLQTDDKGRYDITLSSERCDDHTLSALLQSDGSIRIAMYSMSTSPILGTEGPLFTLNMSAGEELSAYEVQIKNIHASDASGKLYSMADVTGTVTVDYRAGDANGDGMVAVNDVVYTVNKILNNAAEDFIFSAADMNDDNEIMINDVVMIVNTILGTSTTTAALAPRHMNAFETLSVADSRTTYGMTEFGITLSNASRYTAMQFDMELAEGADIADIKVSMPTDHSVAYRRIDDTTVRVVVTSLTNEALAEGAQLRISMEDAAGKTVAFTNGRAACNNGQMVGIMPGSTVLGGTTGIDGVNAEFAPADVYSIDGKVVKKNATTLDGLKPGVYVVNGRKVVVEK